VISKGSRPHKKVIAQQVETVFPQAVSQITDAVPDIYQKADIEDGWVTLTTDLKKGERVRLIGETEEGIHEVLEVKAGHFRTEFKPTSEKVFVFGREVNDYRNVDYDAISMLNVSATQELARRLEAELATKTAEIAALKQRLEGFDQKFAKLERLLEGRSEVIPVSIN
jgi:predicted phage tail protein